MRRSKKIRQGSCSQTWWWCWWWCWWWWSWWRPWGWCWAQRSPRSRPWPGTLKLLSWSEWGVAENWHIDSWFTIAENWFTRADETDWYSILLSCCRHLKSVVREDPEVSDFWQRFDDTDGELDTENKNYLYKCKQMVLICWWCRTLFLLMLMLFACASTLTMDCQAVSVHKSWHQHTSSKCASGRPATPLSPFANWSNDPDTGADKTPFPSNADADMSSKLILCKH